MKSGPVVIIVLHGQNSILRIRKILADTDRNCSCGTIRGDYAVMTGHFSIENDRVINATKNVCHASDSE
jgi:nucleoside-diphosphate kinase